MARKADVKGGNGDVVFDAETGTARKYLRATPHKYQNPHYTIGAK